jgi:hypothetical protein
MGNKLSSTKPRQNSSSGDLDRETHGRWRQSNAVSFSTSTKKESFCNPGPKPKFAVYEEKTRVNPNTGETETYKKRKDLLPLSVYLNEYNSNDTVKYGCKPDQYIKYENGHYCCVDQSQKATPQEMLDVINQALEGFFDNVGFSAAPNSYTKDKHKQMVMQLEFLLHHRNNIMTRHPGLTDNLEVPPLIDENGVENPVTLDELVARFKMPDPALVDRLERTQGSEENTLIAMRNQYKRDEKGNVIRDANKQLVPLYTRRKSGKPKFGGTKHKKRRNNCSNKKRN